MASRGAADHGLPTFVLQLNADCIQFIPDFTQFIQGWVDHRQAGVNLHGR